MARLADFHADARGQLGGQAQPRAENFQDERIARANQFDAAAHADAERFEALGVLVVGRDAAHHGANVRREFIQSHGGNRLFNDCHNDDKIRLPAGKSNYPLPAVDARREANTLFSRQNPIRRRAGRLPAVCVLLSADCVGRAVSPLTAARGKPE